MIENAQSDPRFENNTYIVGKDLHFCMGCPISLTGTDTVGALCIFDHKIRTLSEHQQQLFRQFGQVVEGLLRSNLDWLYSQLAFDDIQVQRSLTARKEDLLDEIAKATGVGGWEYDLETEELFWTKQTRAIVGVDSDFIPTMESGFSYFAPEAQEIIADTVEKAMSTDGMWVSELPFINAQGKHMWVKTTGQGIYKEGKLCRLIGAFQDVSARKMLEQKVSENERLMQSKNNELSAIMEHIPQGVAVYDSRGLLKYWNTKHTEIYHQAIADVKIRQPFTDFLNWHYQEEATDELPEELIAEMKSVFIAGETLRRLYYLKSGSIVEALFSELPDKGWICTSEDITEQEKIRERIHYAAHHDTTTGLANRAKFTEYIEKNLKKYPKHILMLIDLDFFKEVNDTFGHPVGDEVLKSVARRLRRCVREKDMVCRFGGDEFAIILNDIENLEDVAQVMAKRIVESIGKPYRILDHEITIGVSIGMSTIKDDDSQLVQAMKRADAALYAVKHRGRNGYQFYCDQVP
jgi:diguanylate cyclase (GGDEF)-like protein/PAS domain S-box-containing protein